MSARKKILVVSPTLPYPLISGGKIRIYNLLRELSSEFAVTLLTLIEEGDAPAESASALDFLDQLVTIPIRQSRPRQLLRIAFGVHRWLQGTPVEALVKYSREQRRVFRDLVQTHEFDAIQVEYSQLGELLSFPRARACPMSLVAHDVSYMALLRRAAASAGLPSLFWRNEARLMKRWEERAWRSASVVIAMSEHDRALIAEAVTDVQVDVLPNGVDLERNHLTPESTEPTVVFTGWSRHAPNVDGLRWFLGSIWAKVIHECPNVRLKVIGAGFLPKTHRLVGNQKDGVEFLGLVEDVASHVGQAWTSIVPLRMGSGTRLKILESMALGTPVVSTTIGCEGIAVTPGKDILVADTTAAFAESLIALLKDKRLRESLAFSARRTVEQSYSWKTIGDQARSLFRDAIGDGQA